MSLDQITITVPRDLASRLGVLPREDSVHFHSADVGWLSHNVRKRLDEQQRKILHSLIQIALVTYNLSTIRKSIKNAV